MAKKNTNNEQMRRLTNTFVLAGPIAEIIDYKKDKTKDGVPYISFSGTIRCGDSPAYDQRFKIFSTAMKKDMATGEFVDRPNFKKLQTWCDNCVPMTKSDDAPTWAEIGGFIGMNDYVNKENKLISAPQFNVNWTRTYGGEYRAEVNIEGMLQGIDPELDKEDEETGRSKIRIVSTDIYGNAVDLNRIFATAEITNDLDENDYGSGSLSTYFISLIPTTVEQVVKKGGIGQQRVTQARSYLEWMLTGADPIIEEDDANFIEPSVFKQLTAERTNKLNEIKENGYQSGNGEGGSSSKSSGAKAGGFGKKNMKSDEIPF